jgi:DNA-binding transcriptional LysR family regulator
LLSLAASQTVANYWLPRYIHRFRSNHSGISVSLTIGNTEMVAGLIHAGEAELGFIEGEIDDPTLTGTPVAADELVLVVPPGHPWAGCHPDPDRDLKTVQWILRERGSGTRAMFEATLPGLGLAAEDLDVALELPSNEAVRAAVEAGAGVTVLSRLVVASSLGAGTLAAADLPLPGRRFYALRHRERYVTAAEREFLRLVTEDGRDAS